MTKTNISIGLVLILATAIGIHGQTPREATLTLKYDFEDGQSDREFKVDYPGIAEAESAVIKIFQVGLDVPKVEYTIEKNAEKPQLLHFELKKDVALAGSSYEVQVCLPGGTCSGKRAALGEILEENQKPNLSCTRITDKGEESEFDKLVGKPGAKEHKVPINAGKTFVDAKICENLSVGKQLSVKSNPEYKKVGEKYLFYAAVWYDGKPLRELFEEINENGYCSRKYIFWATAHVVNKATKEVVRRYKGTHIVTKELAENYILKTDATDFPVELARYDNEPLPTGEYYVSVSFCASDKDAINSSVCSEAVYAELKPE